MAAAYTPPIDAPALTRRHAPAQNRSARISCFLLHTPLPAAHHQPLVGSACPSTPASTAA